jgi:hypothetical protein
MSDNSESFATQAAGAIAALQEALRVLVGSLPDVRIRRPNDLANALGVDPKLAWRVSQVINGSDPFGAALHVPGRSGMRIFLTAAAGRGAPQSALSAAQAAYERFAELVYLHAGDRRTFDMLIAGHVRQDRQRGDLYHRKLMFQGMSYVWGVQVRVQTLTAIAAPAADSRMLDAAVLKTYADLRRIRPNVPWRITRTYTADALGEVQTALVREPLDPGIHAGEEGPGLPLLTEFCSRPLPECRRVEAPRGVVDYQLVEGAVGNTACITIATGEVVRSVEPRYRTERYRSFNVDFILRTPAELLVFDLLISRDLWEPALPTLGLYSDLFAEGLEWPRLECDRIPIHERVEYLGTGLENLAVAELPRYADMVRYAFERLGWDSQRFDVYRVRMKYPPIPSGILMRRDLPPAPG